jgi:hypothetical protein
MPIPAENALSLSVEVGLTVHSALIFFSRLLVRKFSPSLRKSLFSSCAAKPKACFRRKNLDP